MPRTRAWRPCRVADCARRAWPRLLIASTRLLDGRFRDPLVGRSLLTGVSAGIASMLCVFAGFLVVVQVGWGVLVPALAPRGLDGLAQFIGYVAKATTIQISFAFVDLAVLVVCQLVLRNTSAALATVWFVFFAFFAAWGLAFFGPYPAILVSFAFVLSTASLLVLWKGGVLALATWLIVVTILRDTPWTFDPTQSHAWPTWFATALIAGLALWGFRNVLGRQAMFSPLGLDD